MATTSTETTSTRDLYNGCTAIYCGATNETTVYDKDADELFGIGGQWSVGQLLAICGVYKWALRKGITLGRDSVQAEIINLFNE
jgi:hypothetical protein